jgi:hypothetical protein
VTNIERSLSQKRIGRRKHSEQKYTFHPQVSRKSLLIAQYLVILQYNIKEPSKERILRPKGNCNVEEELTFTPVLNSNSRRLDIRNKENVPRWKYLYELKKSQMVNCELRKREKQQREDEEVGKCTFYPTLIAEFKATTTRVNSSERSKTSKEYNTLLNKDKDNNGNRRNSFIHNKVLI